ncbi:hypothetical protein RB195_000457 [Necator americanus]|uniref:Uncharacterized protein n=1 Tax=Necator americanus TaxID=51031 RepID=A0ABR1DBJ1_NECAM
MAFIHASGRNSTFSSSIGLHVNGQDSLVQPLLTDYYQKEFATNSDHEVDGPPAGHSSFHETQSFKDFGQRLL